MTETVNPKPARRHRAGRLPGRQDWSSWPNYQAAKAGFRGYWYPVCFSSQVGEKPRAVTLLGERLFVIRDNGKVFGMKDRCPHRGVPLSYGNKQFPGTVSCVYHGWTFDLETGELKAVITDGPKSPICGKVTQPTFDVEERLGMVWVFVGDGEKPHPIDEQLPEELVGNPAVVGARLQAREGNWRFACENGYDEGHAKYLHRTSLWRLFKPMPVWNTTKIVRARPVDLPGAAGTVLGRRLSRARPVVRHRLVQGAAAEADHQHRQHGDPPRGQPDDRGPGVPRLRVGQHARDPADRVPDVHPLRVLRAGRRRQPPVRGVLADFKKGARTLPFYAKYLGAMRWLFHGQFSGQDKWMVEVTDAPPEKLYRPDDSLLQWRKLAEDVTEERLDRLRAQGLVD